MRRAILFLILLVSTASSQESPVNLSEFNVDALPDSVKEQISDSLKSKEDTKISVEDSFIDPVNPDPEEEKELPFFGYNFFDTKVETRAPVLDIPLQSDYLISFNDELELLLTGSLDRVIDLRVDLSGNVMIPEVGAISVLNLNLREAEKKINNYLEEAYVGISSFLSIKKASLKKITVVGAVKNPGVFIVNPFITAVEAIKYASGLLENSSLRKIEIIKRNGVKKKVDLYNFLISGDNTHNPNLQNGDTIVIPFTSNFIQIDGEVSRPLVYEYTNLDSIEDLIKYAGGLGKNADIKRIGVDFLQDGKITTSLVSSNYKIGKRRTTRLNVGSLNLMNSLDVMVKLDNRFLGYFDKTKYIYLSDIFDEFITSQEIFPFFVKLEAKGKDNPSRNYYYLSMRDKDTFLNFELKPNTTIHFFSVDRIIEQGLLQDVNENIELQDVYENIELQDVYENYAVQGTNQRYLKTIFYNQDQLIIPMVGKFIPEELINVLGIGQFINYDQLAALGSTKKSSLIDKKTLLDSSELMVISSPAKDKDFIEVSITGEVTSSGTYNVPSGTSLQNLYTLSGGLTERAFIQGIFFSRESIKDREIMSEKRAKDYVFSAIFAGAANPLSPNIALDVNSFLPLLDYEGSNATGRLVGIFDPDTLLVNDYVLQEGDSIYVPPISNSITVVGEVLNPSALSFDDALNVDDYIERAGGLTNFAFKSQIFIIRANGTSIPYNPRIFKREELIYPGDTIIVPRNIEKISGFPLFSTMTKILSDLAFSAAALRSLNN